MIEQHVIQFGFSKHHKRSAEFYRGFIAKAGEKKLPNALFWRNGEGKSICETPEIRWVPSYQGFSIVASEGYEETLNEASSQLMAEFLNSELCKFEVSKLKRTADINEVDDLVTYKADRVLYDASPKKVSEFLGASKIKQREIMEAYLKAELAREAECWGLDESVFIENSNHIRISEMKLLAPAKVLDKKTNDVKRMMSRYAIRFTMPVRLLGTWQVGRQRSKGYGMVSLDRGGWL